MDASAKSPSGFLDGTAVSFGDYDQCLGIVSENINEPFNGKHCMVALKVDNMQLDSSELSAYISEHIPLFEHYHLNVGLCMPSSCGVEDVRTIVSHGNEGSQSDHNHNLI